MRTATCVLALLLSFSLLPELASPASAQASKNPSLTPTASPVSAVDKVIELTKSGLDGDFIVRAIAKDSLHGDLSSDDLLKLKRAGVADAAIRAMMAGPASAPASPSPVSASSSPSTAVP